MQLLSGVLVRVLEIGVLMHVNARTVVFQLEQDHTILLHRQRNPGKNTFGRDKSAKVQLYLKRWRRICVWDYAHLLNTL